MESLTLKQRLINWVENRLRTDPPAVPLAQAHNIVRILRRDYNVKEQTEIVRQTISVLIKEREQDIRVQTDMLNELKEQTGNLKTLMLT